MKKWLCSLLALLLCSVVAVPFVQAGQKELTFLWNQDLPSPNDMKGWKLYQADQTGGPYALLVDIPFTTAAVEYTYPYMQTSPDNQMKRWYFVLRAEDTSGNLSGYSNEVFIDIDFLPPGVPVQFRVIFRTP